MGEVTSRRAREIAVVAAIVTVAALLRLPFLGTGLWRDEAATYFESTAPTIAKALHEIGLAEISPPGYFLLMRVWIGLVGVSDLAYKLPSFIFSLATVILTYLLGRTLRSHAAGVVAAALGAATLSGMMLAGTARPYALAAALTASLALAALATLRRSSWRFATAYALLAYAVMEVQYTGIVVVATFALVAAAQAARAERRRGALRLLVASVVAAIAYAPQIPLFLHTARVSVPWLPTLRPQSLGGRLIEQFTYVLPFEVARTALALECIVPALVLAIVYRRRLLVSDYPLLVLPVLVATWLETKALLLHPRYMFAYTPLAEAVVGAALIALVARVRSLYAARRWRGQAFVAAAFVVALVLTLVPAVPKQVRIDVATIGTPALSGMRDVARTMPVVFAGRTLVVVAPDYLGPTVGYYARDEHAVPLGFPHRVDPQLFRWDGYGDAWHVPGIVPAELRFVLDRFDGKYDRLALLTDPRVVDRGTIPYSIVRILQHDLERRLPVLERRSFPGRDEAVSVTLFAHPREVQRRPSRSST